MSQSPTTSPLKLLVIPIGGLGASQLDEIADRLGRIPGVVVGKLTGWDQNRDSRREIWPWMNMFRDLPIIFIGHSLGAETARCEANAAITDSRKVAGVVLLDRVTYDNDHAILCDNVLALRAGCSFPFIVSDVGGHPAETIPHTGHNSLCHHVQAIEMVENFVKDEL